MSSPDESFDVVASIQTMLAGAGRELQADPDDTRYLRDIQWELRDLVNYEADDRITLLLFFVPLIVDDVYYNLVGDIVGIDSHAVDKARTAVFRHLGQSLLDMADALDRGDFDALHSIYSELVVYYLSYIKKLNAEPRRALDSTSDIRGYL